MIYTLTLNPSLDYLLDTPDFSLDKTNRSKSESLHFGGKGINVSYVLKQLGIESVCLGFVAGFTGDELERLVAEEGINVYFVRLKKGNTRINVKIRGESITEINAKGPEIYSEDLEKLFKKLEIVDDGDTVVLAGSAPEGLTDIYSEILSFLSDKNVRIVADTSGKMLLNILKFKPFLIKPNKAELSEILGTSFESDDQIIEGARKLKEMGAVNVLVSLGEDGAMLIDENSQVHRIDAFKIIPVSTVGAGDSMIAGFLAGIDKGYEYALKLGNICGAATASVEILADREKIESMM